jgi:hypothetical protein
MKMLLLWMSLLIVQDNARREFGVISGQLRASDGSPAHAVRVAAMPLDENGATNPAAATLASLAETDSQGRFRLENIPPGRYLITAGFLDFPSYYPGVKTSQEARGITVAAAQTISNIDFTLTRPIGVRVRGRVRNLPVIIPAGFFRIALQPIQRPGNQLMETSVASDGTFEFAKAPPGSYNARLTSGGSSPLRIDVDDKDVENVELSATPLIFGRVIVEDGTPLPVEAAAVARDELVGVDVGVPRGAC